jgi:hypothetical protein
MRRKVFAELNSVGADWQKRRRQAFSTFAIPLTRFSASRFIQYFPRKPIAWQKAGEGRVKAYCLKLHPA